MCVCLCVSVSVYLAQSEKSLSAVTQSKEQACLAHGVELLAAEERGTGGADSPPAPLRTGAHRVWEPWASGGSSPAAPLGLNLTLVMYRI